MVKAGTILLGLVLLLPADLPACHHHHRYGAGPSAIDERVTLRLDEKVVLDDQVALRFDRLVEDSRCPANATCIVAGQAVVDLVLSTRHGDERLRLSTVPGRRAQTAAGILVELVAVDPYPIAGQATPREEYRVTVQVAH